MLLLSCNITIITMVRALRLMRDPADHPTHRSPQHRFSLVRRT
jgi:hypothetical protein